MNEASKTIPKGWEHQSRFITLSKTLPGVAAFMGVGLGKTFASIRALCEEMNASKRLYRVLIFTKPLVVPQFEEEWYKFSNIGPRDITKLQDSQKDRLGDFQAAVKAAGERGHIFVTNTEALLMKDLYQAFLDWRPDAIIFDESHDLKNHEAKRSEAAYALANPFDKRTKVWAPKPKTILLSGSPVLSSPLDIFQQVKVMLGGWPTREYFEVGGRQHLIYNYFHFRNRFFRDRNANFAGSEQYWPDWQPMNKERDGFDAIGELAHTLSKISIYATKWTCPELNLPPEEDYTIACDLTVEQRKAYEAMKKDFIAYVSDTRAATASLAITKSLRLLQIVSGFVSTQGRGEEDDVADVRFAGTEKDAKLEKFIRDVAPTEKILIWAVWRENYAAIRKICEKIGVEYVEVHGGITDRKKLANVHDFKTRDRTRVSIGHPGSGGVGLNLTVATQDAFYSRNYSTLHFVQARGRNHRAGQTKRVRHNNFTCGNTIDETVLVQLSANLAMAESLLDPSKKNISLKDVAAQMMMG